VDNDIKFCKSCGIKMDHTWPVWRSKSNDPYCYDCAFKLGMVSEKQYIKDSCFWCYLIKRAEINPETGEIETTDKKFSWERPLRDYRHTKQYQDWRKAVFERDNFTCQDCGQRGGKLEAHHIKTFKKYPKLRYILENGITLCRSCHMKRHKRGEVIRQTSNG
jgi:hypothetical protein